MRRSSIERANPTAAAVLTLAVLLAPRFVWGQVAPDDGLIQEGLELRRQGRDAEALERFRRAHELRATPRSRAQMAMAEQALGRWVDAELHLSEALRATDDPWVQRTRAALEGAMQTIQQHLGRLEVRCNVPGARAQVDGRPAGALPSAEPLHVPPGTVVLSVAAEGYFPVSRQVTVTLGAVAREFVELVPLPPLVAAVEPPGPTPSRAGAARPGHEPDTALALRRTLGWVSAGAALVFIAGGASSLALGNSAIEHYNSAACLPPNGSASRGEACGTELDEGLTLRTVGVAGLIVGGLLGAASAVFFLTSRAGPRGARAWSCGPALGAGGVSCVGRF